MYSVQHLNTHVIAQQFYSFGYQNQDSTSPYLVRSIQHTVTGAIMQQFYGISCTMYNVQYQRALAQLLYSILSTVQCTTYSTVYDVQYQRAIAQQQVYGTTATYQSTYNSDACASLPHSNQKQVRTVLLNI